MNDSQGSCLLQVNACSATPLVRYNGQLLLGIHDCTHSDCIGMCVSIIIVDSRSNMACILQLCSHCSVYMFRN
jgi:hypothetical protein